MFTTESMSAQESLKLCVVSSVRPSTTIASVGAEVAGVGFEVPGCAAATGLEACSGVPETPMRRSSRSRRARLPASESEAAGTRTLAHMSSSWSFGLVAPDIELRVSLTTSEACVSEDIPNANACVVSFSISSFGTPRSTEPALLPTASTTIKSRSRSSRSSTKRLGSCPV